MNYDIIFSDIDGTLVDDRHNPMPKTAKKIKQITEEGIPFILVSARPPRGVKRVLDMIGFSWPMICFCGGVITDKDGNIVFDEGIPIDTAIGIKDYFDTKFPEVCVCSYLYDRWLCDDKTHYWVNYEIGVTAMTPEELSLRELKKSENKVHKLLCMGDPEQMDKAEAELRELFDGKAAIYRSKKEYIEVTPAGVSKSRAMKVLCENYNTDISRAMAFGDNFNDLDMLECAGMVVAMGNSPDEIKAVCKYVTDDNNSEGIYNALVKLM